ncbi:MAG: hypothetical protein U0470_09365 [Anaerolineae bacterium]
MALASDSTSFGGRIDGVAAFDGRAAFGMGSSLLTVEVDGGAAPRIVGRVDDLRVHWGIGSIAIGDGLAWILSDRPDDDPYGPFRPCASRESPVSVAMEVRAEPRPSRQQRSYAAPPAVVVDVSRPGAPRVARVFDFESGNGFEAIAARGRRAVTQRRSNGAGLELLDADSGSDARLLTLPDGWRGRFQWLDDEHLVLVGSTPTSVGRAWHANTRLDVVRLADGAASGAIISSLPIAGDGQVVGMVTDGTTAFVLMRDVDPVLITFDLSRPDAPRLVDRLVVPVGAGDVKSCARSLALSPDGRTLYFSRDRRGVSAVAVEADGRLAVAPMEVDMEGGIVDIAAVGSRVVVAAGASLTIAGPTSAALPTISGRWRTLLDPTWAALRGDHAYVIGSDMGLDVVDLANGRPTRLRGRVQLSHLAIEDKSSVGIAVGAGDTVWAMAAGTLYGIDVGDPDAPRIISRYVPSTPVRALAVDGERVAITGGACVELLDVANPALPMRLGEVAIPLPGNASRTHCPDSLALVGDRLYLGGEALRIVDIGDPQRPRALDGLAHPVRDIAAADGLVITGDVAHDGIGERATVFDVRADRWRSHVTFGCGYGCPQVAMAPLGRWIAVVVRDQAMVGLTARLLDASTLADTGLRWQAYADEPGDLAIDGARILTTSGYTDLRSHRLWPVEIVMRAFLPQLWTGPRDYRP